MATSGVQEQGSSELNESDTNCSSCQTDGLEVAAVGYCVDCNESLCQRCFDVHLIPTMMRKHVLVEKESTRAPGVVTGEGTETTSRTCPQHDEEDINYHCPTHSFFGCQFCFYKHQKTCKDVICIPEVCQDLANSAEYRDFTEKLTDVSKKSTELAAKFERNIETIKSSHAKTVAEIQDFKKGVVEEIEKSEKDLFKEADRVKNEDCKKAKESVQKCNEVLKENRKIASQIERMQKSGNQTDLYIAMVESKSQLKTVEENLLSSVVKSTVGSSTFKGNSDLKKVLSKPWLLGQVKCTSEIEKFHYELDVNIKSGSDEKDCRLVGSAVLPKYLVLTDENNESVKLVDLNRNRLLSELRLSSSPLGVCKISGIQVAVAQRDKIVLINTEPTLKIDREIAITEGYHGIAYHSEKLVVSFSQSVKIMDIQGNILNVFQTDDQGKPLFKDPYHVAINHETALIYVSNSSLNDVVCMEFDGTIITKYTDGELNRPWQMIIDSYGMVYVCGELSHNIHQMTADCKKVKIIASKAGGLKYPRIISFDENKGNMIIGGDDNKLLIFSVKYASH